MDLHVGVAGAELLQRGREAAVDLERVHRRRLRGQTIGQQAGRGADLEDDVVGRARQPDAARPPGCSCPRGGSARSGAGTSAGAQPAGRAPVMIRPRPAQRRAARWRSSREAALAVSQPRTCCQRRRRVLHERRPIGLAAPGDRRQEGRVGLDQQQVLARARGGVSQVRRVGEGQVAGVRLEVAARIALRDVGGLREAVQDDAQPLRRARASRRRASFPASLTWTTSGSRNAARGRSAPRTPAPGRRAARGRGSSRGHTRRRRRPSCEAASRASSASSASSRRAASWGCRPTVAYTPGVRSASCDRRPRRGDVDADRHDGADTLGPRLGKRPVGVVEHVEMTMRVDQRRAEAPPPLGPAGGCGRSAPERSIAAP